MFILKKIISAFLYPLPFSLLLSFLGLYFLWFTNKQKAGKILVSAGLVVLTLFSYHVIADKLLRPLERQYDVFEMKGATPATPKPAVRFVVVLGGGQALDSGLPLLSQMSDAPVVRLMEGIRIYRKFPGSRLLLSGGGGFSISEAEMMARVAIEMGVPERDIILESKSRDTRDEALFIKPMVGNEPFVLVTTASHIPRSMALFRKLGMNPIASPIGHSVKDDQRLSFYSFFPSTGSTEKSELAIHEYLGMIWAKLRGQM
ncbi:MAG: envelope biogenesis factor ElyC [Candidatus Scalindua sp.]|nr:envelope biogenesis factor ElyC [Candidatus Scalindua sp.]